MCNPTYIAIAALSLSALQSQQQYQADKARARAQEDKNKAARKSSQIAYLADLNKLDRDAIAANKLAAKDKEAGERDLIVKQDEALLTQLESGNANVDAVLRDVGFDYESEFSKLDQKVYDNNLNTIFGYDDAYAAMRRSFNQVPDVFKPSKAGLLIDVASSAVTQYGNVQGGKYGESKSSDLNTGEIG